MFSTLQNYRIYFFCYLAVLAGLTNGLAIEQDEPRSSGIINEECELEINPEVAKIAGAETVGTVDRWPYMVALQLPFDNDYGYVHHCAGVLIAPNLVLTAAQCVWIQGGVDFRFDNRFAEGPIQGGLVAAIQPFCRHQMGLARIPIVRYYMHPEYIGTPITSGNHDVAVLVLQEAAPTAGPFMNYQNVTDLDPDFVALAVSLGWGGTDLIEQQEPELFANSVQPLQIAGLSLFKPSRCEDSIQSADQNIDISIERSQVICGFNQNVRLCFGDSGGPLIFADGAATLQVGSGNPSNDILLGIVSWGPDFTCSDSGTTPTVFANMKAYVAWIDSVVNIESMPEQQEQEEEDQSYYYYYDEEYEDEQEGESTFQGGPVAVLPVAREIPMPLFVDHCERPESLICDRNALLQFRLTRQTFSSSLWTWTGQNPCEGWYGVKCTQLPDSSAWRVTSVNLGGAQGGILGGELLPVFSQLCYLQELDISNRGLTGTIPAGFSTLKRIKRLRFSFNNLEGTLPPDLSYLRQLEYLALPSNQLTGTLPSDYSVMTNLRFLSLSENSLSGSLPKEYSALVKMQEMVLGENELGGEIPEEWGEWPELQKLWVNGNGGICGGLPQWAENLQARVVINLGKQIATTGTSIESEC